jgi:hypothetical protein
MTAKTNRRNRDLDSIRALRGLLQQIAADPSQYLPDESVKSMLKSQGAMAKHHTAGLSIHAMSLNHHKAMAKQALGDYRSLDTLRRNAIRALGQEERRRAYERKNKKSDVITKNSKLEQELSALREDLILLQRAYDIRCVQARNYAKSAGAATVALCHKEQREIEASISSIRNRRKQEGSVVAIRDSGA